MAELLTLVLLAATIAVVGAPLLARRSVAAPEPPAGAGPSTIPSIADRCAELRTAREAKYREIGDAELDYRTGKLSREDYEAVDAALRAEAIEILDELQSLDAEA